MNSDYPLTLEEFKSWLLRKDKTEIIGDMTLVGSSPIANALKDIENYEVVVLTDYTIYNGFCVINPDWVKDFNKNILAEDYYRITVYEALKVL